MNFDKTYGECLIRIALGITVIAILTGFACAEQGLVAEYHFDGDANDSSGNGNNGTIYGGAAFVDGVNGQAMSFDGVDDYVDAGESNSLKITGDQLTMMAWINANGNAGPNNIIVNKEGEYELGLTDNLSGHVKNNSIWWAVANTNPGWDGRYPNYTIDLNKWCFVAVVYDGNSVKTYINGILVHSLAASGAIGDFHSDMNKLWIGWRQNQNTNPFKGIIDEVKIYNRTLTSDEIRQNYEQFALSNSGNGIWQHKLDLSITNPESPLNYYQILVNLTGVDFPIEANTTGDDIRFTNSSDELPYWIESWDYTNRSGQVWVNVTNVPSGVSSLRMWYGNPNATSSSNGNTTFIFFDDFNDGILDTSKWYTLAQNIVEENGYLRFIGIGSADPVETISNYGDVVISYEGLSEVEEIPYIYARAVYPYQNWNYETQISSIVCCHGSSGYLQYPNELRSTYKLNQSTISDISTPFDFDLNNWYKQEMYLYKDKVLVKVGSLNNSRSALLSYTAANVSENGKIAFSAWLSAGKIDDVRVRKYTSTEPYIVGYINGTVQNNSIGIAEAIVTTNTNISTKTNSSGFYSLRLPSGEYHLTAVSEPGFYINNSINVNVVAGTTLIQDIELLKKSTGNISGSVSAN